jgi:60 kDa SS-A/Ro ribonucleoprotein
MAALHNYTNSLNNTAQTQPIPGKESRMEANNAGGYAYTITPMQQFRRFLVLGSEGGTMYVTEQKLTADNAKNATALFASEQGIEAVQMLRNVAINNLAPKVSPILFALALALSSPRRDVKKTAANIFADIVRTNSHMLEFISYANSLRGWGRTLRDVVRSWYLYMPNDKLAYQVAKYRNRHTWTTRDALRMCKPNPEQDVLRSSIYKWAVGKGTDDNTPAIILASETAMREETPTKDVIKLITDFGLTREMISNAFLKDKKVWAALLENMPATAMVRNLGKMSEVGLLTALSATSKDIVDRLHNPDYIKKSRLHPLAFLLALTTYKAGKGVKGSLVWTPVQPVVDALEAAFYMSFGNVVPTNKSHFIALDVSGSMGWGDIANTHLTPREAGMALALVAARTEPNYLIAGFQRQLLPLNVTANDSLTTALQKTKDLTFGSTDCSAPMQYAIKNKMDVDAFVVITDNETYAGSIHPSQALDAYRQQVGHDVKLVVMGMTATRISILDPMDPSGLEVVGFDASVPQVMADFIRG